MGSVIVRFWEARVEDGRLDDALAFVRGPMMSRVTTTTGYDSAEVFAAEERDGQPARVVLLTRWIADPGDLDESLPADGSIARAHGWYFHAV